MVEMLRLLVRDPVSHLIFWSVAIIYVLLFQIALGDLTVDARAARAPEAFLVPGWGDMIWRTRGPFHFEPIGMLEAPFVVWLISPVTVAIGVVLGALTGAQIALVRIARRCAVQCGLSPLTGVLAGLPGLLAGTACCAPLLFLLLGVQVTAGLLTLMGLMVPIAFLLLLAGMLISLHYAARRCGRTLPKPG
jgi:hypothetical protein